MYIHAAGSFMRQFILSKTKQTGLRGPICLFGAHTGNYIP